MGQVLCPAISPPNDPANRKPYEKVKAWIEKYHIGNIYLTARRMNPVGAARFLNSIQEISRIPIHIHEDLEPGTGGRFDGGTILPLLMSLAQTGSEQLVFEAAALTAKEARAMGIHLVYSPVLDVNLNPDNPNICVRAFSDKPEVVARLGKVYVKGLQENGLIATGKHFPGLGDVNVDTHSKTALLDVPRERLDSVELYPYYELIPAGMGAVMTAHVSIPVIDPTPDLPATLSKPVMTGLLREAMGFDGLVITDAFDMGGILDAASFEELAVQSFIAGNDIILLWSNPQFEKVVPHFIKSVEEGRITSESLDTSVRRILKAKARQDLHMDRMVDPDMVPDLVNTQVHRDKAAELWKRSLVLVRNDNDIIPLKKEELSISIVIVNDDREHPEIGNTFMSEMEKKGNIISSYSLDPESPDSGFEGKLRLSSESDVIVVGLFARIYARRGSSKVMHEQLAKFIRDLSKYGKPVILISFNSPYLISQFPEVDGYMVATEPAWDFYGYDKHRPGQIAAAKALFGETEVNGKLSVTIPDLYSYGHGIQLEIQE